MSLHRKLNERERMAYASVARLERERDDLRAQLAEAHGLLREIEGCPWVVEEATIPRAGIEAAPQQVVGTMHVGLMRLRKIRAALSASAEPSARELKVLEDEKRLGIERLPAEPKVTSDHRLMQPAPVLTAAEQATWGEVVIPKWQSSPVERDTVLVSRNPSAESARLISRASSRILTSDKAVADFYREVVEASVAAPDESDEQNRKNAERYVWLRDNADASWEGWFVKERGDVTGAVEADQEVDEWIARSALERKP